MACVNKCVPPTSPSSNMIVTIIIIIKYVIQYIHSSYLLLVTLFPSNIHIPVCCCYCYYHHRCHYYIENPYTSYTQVKFELNKPPQVLRQNRFTPTIQNVGMERKKKKEAKNNGNNKAKRKETKNYMIRRYKN